MEFPDLEKHFVNPFVRIEPRCRTDDFSRGVQARTADPLWMLARQWQTGEFQGEDAGSPIHVRLRHSTQPVEDLRLGSSDAGPLGIRPLETAVEEEDPVTDFRERVRIGQEFERRLLARLNQDAGEDVARALVIGLRDTYAFPQKLGGGGPQPLSDDDIARLDRATQRFVRFMQGRVVDGISVLHGLAAPAGYETHQPALDSVAGEIPGWRNSVCSTPDNKRSPAWQGSKLDYHFELNTHTWVNAAAPDEIVEGIEIPPFVIRRIVLRGAPEGAYTFRQDGPRASEVRLLHNGVEVLQLGYNWQTTISFDDPYRFSFPGYFDIDIGRQGSGTQNLARLNESVFDGNRVLPVQASTHLVAPDYRNGEIDWYTFDTGSAERGSWLSAASQESTPTRLALASTSPRWWAFEDGRTYFGGLDVNRPDLAKLLLMEMVLINADDWFSVPVPVEMGRLARIDELTVSNVFGDEDQIQAREIDGEPDERFELFTLSPAGRQREPGCGDFIFVPPVAGFRIESPPIDEVLFARDEGANMVWGIEHLVPNGLGRPVSGFDAQLERIATEREADLARLQEELAERRTQLKDETLGPAEREALEQQVGTLQGQIARLTAGASGPSSQTEVSGYYFSTTVPKNWIPFLPKARESQDGARHPRVQLQRARMLRHSDATEKIRSQSRLLALKEKPLLWLNEESVLRAGVRVQLTKQRVRWVDGTTHVWLGRKVLTGRGEGSSGLKFDVAEQEKS